MKPDYTVTEERPASRLDPDPLFTEEEQTEIRRRHDEAVTAECNVWLGLLVLVVVVAVLGAVAIILIASAPRGAAHRGVSTRATAVHVRFEPLLGAPSKGSPFEDTGAPQAAVGGTATWYCGHGSACTRGYGPSDLVAAVDPSLGIARGTLLTVRHAGRAVVVRAVDNCACSGRRIVDLTSGAFSRLSSLSKGVIVVELEVGAPRLPNTDTEVGND